MRVKNEIYPQFIKDIENFNTFTTPLNQRILNNFQTRSYILIKKNDYLYNIYVLPAGKMCVCSKTFFIISL